MITIYLTDSNRIYTNSIEINEFDAIPKGSSLIEPPKTTGTQVARLLGSSWEILPEYPVITPVPIPVPSKVSKAQGKAALVQFVLLDSVVSFINNISDPSEKTMAEIAFNDTTEWERSSPFLNSAKTALNLSDEDLDELFIYANQIKL